MKNITLISICILLYIGANAQNSNWENIIYNANKVHHIFPDGNAIYLGTNSGYTILDRGTGTQMNYNISNTGLLRSKTIYIHGDGMGKHWFNNDGLTYSKEGSDWQYHPNNFPYSPIKNIRNIRHDSHGNMWYLASDLLVKFDGYNYQFFDYTNSPLSFTMISNPKFEIDANDNVWITEYDEGLFKHDGTSFEFYSVMNSNLPSEKLNGLTVLDNGDIYLATADSGIVVFDGTTFSSFNTTNSELYNNRIYEIEHHNNSVYGISGGFNVWSEIFKIENDSLSMFNASNSGLPLNHFNHLALDDEGTCWFQSNAGNQHVILEFDGNFLTTHQLKNFPLVSDNVKDISFSTNGNIRFLNQQENNSLSDLIEFQNNQFQYINTSIATGNKIIDHTNGTFIYGGYDELILVGSSSATTYNSTNSVIPSEIIVGAQKDAAGNIWFASNEGLVKYNGNAFSLEYSFSTGFMVGSQLKSFSMDQAGNFWMVASNSVGRRLIQFDGTNYTVYDSSHPDLTDDFYNLVQCSDNGNVYAISASKKLIKYDGSSFNYVLDLNYIDPNFEVCHLNVFSDEVWMGSLNDGVVYFDSNSAQIFNASNSPLVNNNIHGFTKDNAANVWIATDGGISIYNENKVILSTQEVFSEFAKEDAASIYPNPFTDEFTLRISKEIVGSIFRVYNAQGMEVKSIQILNTSQNVMLNEASGLYFYHITKEGEILQEGKIVKN